MLLINYKFEVSFIALYFRFILRVCTTMVHFGDRPSTWRRMVQHGGFTCDSMVNASCCKLQECNRLSCRNGTFYDGHMHGIGVYTDIETGVPLEARMIKSELICYLNGTAANHSYLVISSLLKQSCFLYILILELEPGVQVEINDSSLCVPLGSRATILKNTKGQAPLKLAIYSHDFLFLYFFNTHNHCGFAGWKFRCRFQDELNPRERQVWIHFLCFFWEPL